MMLTTESVSMDDFFPATPVTTEDFYPDGTVTYFRPVPRTSRHIGPDAAAILLPLLERLRAAVEVEIELVTIMEFCETVLRSQGVKLHVVRETPVQTNAN